jgi:hypothetical protein
VGSLSVKEMLSERGFRDFVAARRIMVGVVSNSSLILFSLSPLSVDIKLCSEGGGTLAGSVTLIVSASWLRLCA